MMNLNTRSTSRKVLRAQGGYIARFAMHRAAGSATAETERNLKRVTKANERMRWGKC